SAHALQAYKPGQALILIQGKKHRCVMQDVAIQDRHQSKSKKKKHNRGQASVVFKLIKGLRLNQLAD
ncbi:MAG: hypothetical protein OEZ23_02965, partial [Gammaproteobacteria bacterium]|nr:hypothetical protein [Gammaproteobacteria bacterium]